MYRLLIFVFTILFGNYINFVNKMIWIKERYIFKDFRSNENDNEKKSFSRTMSSLNQNGILEHQTLSTVWFYLKYESSFKSLLQKCFKTNKREFDDNMAIFKGSKAFDFEFNFRNVLDRMRLSNFES